MVASILRSSFRHSEPNETCVCSRVTDSNDGKSVKFGAFSVATLYDDGTIGSPVLTESTGRRDVDQFLNRELILVTAPDSLIDNVSSSNTTCRSSDSGSGKPSRNGANAIHQSRACFTKRRVSRRRSVQDISFCIPSRTRSSCLREEGKELDEEPFGVHSDSPELPPEACNILARKVSRRRSADDIGRLRHSITSQNPKSVIEHESRNDSVGNMKYSLGDSLRSSNDVLGRDDRTNIDEVNSLQKYDFAFVKRANGSYTYSIVADKYSKKCKKKGMGPCDEGIYQGSDETEEVIMFVLDEKGRTKIVPKHRWDQSIRCLKPPTQFIICDRSDLSYSTSNRSSNTSDGGLRKLCPIPDLSKKENEIAPTEPVISPNWIETHPGVAPVECQSEESNHSRPSSPKSPVELEEEHRIDSVPPLPLCASSDANSAVEIKSCYSYGLFTPYESTVGDVYWA